MPSTALAPADLRDQMWLDARINEVESGVIAVIDIYRNWADGANVGRLHPGLSAFEYIKANVASFQLGRPDVPALIEGTNLSFSAIARLTETSRWTVQREAEHVQSAHVEPRVGIDGTAGRTGRPRNVTPAPVAASIEVIEAEEEFDYDEPAITLMNPTVEWLATAATTLTARGAATRFWNSLSADDQRLVQSSLRRLIPVLTDLSERQPTQ